MGTKHIVSQYIKLGIGLSASDIKELDKDKKLKSKRKEIPMGALCIKCNRIYEEHTGGNLRCRINPNGFITYFTRKNKRMPKGVYPRNKKVEAKGNTKLSFTKPIQKDLEEIAWVPSHSKAKPSQSELNFNIPAIFKDFEEAGISGEMTTSVNHPVHYGGDVPYEVIKVLEAWEKMFPSFNFNRATAVKYIPRAGEKNKEKEIEDLEKAIWYLQREVTRLKHQ